MKVDLLIRNGHVIDPFRNIDGVADIAVASNKTAAPADGPVEAVKAVDARGCYVFPGLVDFHTHTFYGGSRIAAHPDFLLCTGVTAAVDAGSAGWTNYRAFRNDVLLRARLRMKSYLCCAKFGVEAAPESYAPGDVDARRITDIFNRFGEHLLGLKIRVSKGLCDSVEPLRNAVALAEELGTGICVHTTNPPCEAEEIAALLRPGDVFCHMYHGKGSTLLDAGGKVKRGIRAARERGVLFDVANGMFNYSFATAAAAMADGFAPDIVGTDTTGDKLFYNQCVRDLPHVMSKMLAHGLPLSDLVRAVTAAPAKAMGLEGRIGTLAPGAFADIAVFRIEDCPSVHTDADGGHLAVRQLFKPMMTVADGEIAFCQAEFNLFNE